MNYQERRQHNVAEVRRLLEMVNAHLSILAICGIEAEVNVTRHQTVGERSPTIILTAEFMAVTRL